jgi:hypothetical protein
MCQPGRPGPQGDSQAGSFSFDAFQSAKSAGWRLRFDHVGVALARETFHRLYHVGDVLGRARLVVGPLDPETRHVLQVLWYVARGDLAPVDALLVRPPYDLVVDVGDVDHIDHLEPRVLQVAPDRVPYDTVARVAEVARVVDRRPADVHLDLPRLEGLEGLLLPGQRVVDDEGHRLCPTASWPAARRKLARRGRHASTGRAGMSNLPARHGGQTAARSPGRPDVPAGVPPHTHRHPGLDGAGSGG